MRNKNNSSLAPLTLMIFRKVASRLTYIFSLIVCLLALQTHQASAEQHSVFAEEIIDNNAHLMLTAREYGKLEQKYQLYLDLYSSNRMTAEALSAKFEIFSKSPGLETRFDEWVAAYPKSYSARLGRGISQVTSAWDHRGNKFSNETTDAQLKQFNELLKEAISDLILSLQFYSRPVESYRYLIKISRGLGLGGERNLLDKAIALDLDAFYPRREYLISITPKWGGNTQLMANFVEECRKSGMSNKNKVRVEGDYYFYLSEQALFEKNYKAASDYSYKFYATNKSPDSLYASGKAALDGSLMDLAFTRFDELSKLHPNYPYGFERRGYLYETHFKEYSKAIDDYLVAAELGDSWAQNRLGWYYMMGTYVSTDLDKAKLYLQRAADQGNQIAVENLAILTNLKSNANKQRSH